MHPPLLRQNVALHELGALSRDPMGSQDLLDELTLVTKWGHFLQRREVDGGIAREQPGVKSDGRSTTRGSMVPPTRGFARISAFTVLSLRTQAPMAPISTRQIQERASLRISPLSSDLRIDLRIVVTGQIRRNTIHPRNCNSLVKECCDVFLTPHGGGGDDTLQQISPPPWALETDASLPAKLVDDCSLSIGWPTSTDVGPI